MKPRPHDFPRRDPASFLFPLFDAYGRSARVKGHAEDPRSSPYFAEMAHLPEKIFMVVPTIDILVAEQLQFAEKVNGECEKVGRPKKVDIMVMEKCFHAWLECEQPRCMSCAPAVH